MRILPADPNVRPPRAAPENLTGPGDIRVQRRRVNLGRVRVGEVRLREPATRRDILRTAYQRPSPTAPAYPASRFAAEPTSGRRTRRRLRWAEFIFLVLGLLGVGTWGWFYAQSKVFQAYQSWRLDQLVKRRPAELRALVEKYLAEIGIEGTKESPPPTVAPASPMIPSPSPPPPLPVGSLIGRIEIPRLALSTIVLEGDSSRILRKAAGHIPGTALPGAAGNVAIAAHRDTFFRALRNVHQGDLIALDTTTGVYRYKVDSTRIVDPNDVGVLKPLKHPSLTLVTCYPFYYVGSAPKRYIVQARQIRPQLTSQTDTSNDPAPMASVESSIKLPLTEVSARAIEESDRPATSNHQFHQVRAANSFARRPMPHRAGRSAKGISIRAQSKWSDQQDSVAAAEFSDPPANARNKPRALRRRALAVRKRLASWFRSFPAAHASQ